MKKIVSFALLSLIIFSSNTFASEKAEKNKILDQVLLTVQEEKSEKEIKFKYLKNLYRRLFERFQAVSRKFSDSRDREKFNKIFIDEYFKEKQKERKLHLDLQKKLYLQNTTKEELQTILGLKIHPLAMNYALNIVGSNFDSNDFKILLSQKAIYNPATPALLKEILAEIFQRAKKENIDSEKLSYLEKSVFEAFDSKEYQDILSNYITTTDQDVKKFNLPQAQDERTGEKEKLAQDIASEELSYLNNPEIYRLNRLLGAVLYKVRDQLNSLEEEKSKFVSLFKTYLQNEGREKIKAFYQQSFVKIMAEALPRVYSLQELKEIKHFNSLDVVKKLRKVSAVHHNTVKNDLIKKIKQGKAPFQLALVNALHIAKKQGLDKKIVDEELQKLKEEFKALSKD